MMANSVAQVVNGIQSSTWDSNERQMFSELMTKLLSIPNIFEEEIVVICKKLSKNPKII